MDCHGASGEGNESLGARRWAPGETIDSRSFGAHPALVHEELHVHPERPSVFFDVDDTLVTWTHRLRPYAREVMAELSAMGCAVYVWSGAGLRWEVVDVHCLRPFVRNCYRKPLSRHRDRLLELEIDVVPDHVVDDDDEIVAAFGGTHVPAPLEPLDEDRELLRVLTDVRRRFAL